MNFSEATSSGVVYQIRVERIFTTLFSHIWRDANLSHGGRWTTRDWRIVGKHVLYCSRAFAPFEQRSSPHRRVAFVFEERTQNHATDSGHFATPMNDVYQVAAFKTVVIVGLKGGSGAAEVNRVAAKNQDSGARFPPVQTNPNTWRTPLYERQPIPRLDGVGGSLSSG